MTGKNFAIPAILSLCLCGCFPAPHRTQLVPALTGVVTQSGQSIAGAEVRVTYEYDKTYTVVVGTTDAKGRFTYPGKKKFHMFVFYGDPGFDWTLTINHQGKDTLGFSDHGLGYVPEQANFACDLGATAELACVQR